MPWVSTNTSSVLSYGFLPLSVITNVDPGSDIGVRFVIAADDQHAAYAFDDFRGFPASDSSRPPPP